jgi:hypothetical protein
VPTLTIVSAPSEVRLPSEAVLSMLSCPDSPCNPPTPNRTPRSILAAFGSPTANQPMSNIAPSHGLSYHNGDSRYATREEVRTGKRRWQNCSYRPGTHGGPPVEKWGRRGWCRRCHHDTTCQRYPHTTQGQTAPRWCARTCTPVPHPPSAAHENHHLKWRKRVSTGARLLQLVHRRQQHEFRR